MNLTVDQYINNSKKWGKELEELRRIILDCGLTEEVKWGAPAYTFQKANIVITGELNDCCVLGFFKGALMDDAHGILTKPGENTQSARAIRFTNVREISKLEPVLKSYIYEAIEVEKAGLKVSFKKPSEFAVPEEFQNKLNKNARLKTAFDSLTPGRQRGYLLYFSAPKQSKTRESRIEKCIPQILKGKGLNDGPPITGRP